jgi:O-antigen/teichoic acid export membrane protein
VVVPGIAILAPRIYGNDFQATGALFIGLGVVSCLQSVLHPITAFAGALRRPLLILAATTVGLVFDLGLVLAFVPPFGAAGAVVGNCAGQLVALTGFTWILRRHLNLSVQATAHALLPFVAVLVWVACVSAAAVVAQSSGLDLVAVTAGAILIAAAGSVLAIRLVGGLVTDEDLAAVDASFPRAANHLRFLVGKLGLVRSEASRQPTDV